MDTVEPQGNLRFVVLCCRWMGHRVDFLQLVDGDLGVEARGIKIGMTQELLNEADVGPILQHLGCAGVTKKMATSTAAKIGRFHISGNEVRKIPRCEGLPKR